MRGAVGEDHDIALIQLDTFAASLDFGPALAADDDVEAGAVAGFLAEVERPGCPHHGAGRQGAAEVNRFEHLCQHVEARIETLEHEMELLTHSDARQGALSW